MVRHAEVGQICASEWSVTDEGDEESPYCRVRKQNVSAQNIIANSAPCNCQNAALDEPCRLPSCCHQRRQPPPASRRSWRQTHCDEQAGRGDAFVKGADKRHAFPLGDHRLWSATRRVNADDGRQATVRFRIRLNLLVDERLRLGASGSSRGGGVGGRS